jgi:hypothetical protein
MALGAWYRFNHVISAGVKLRFTLPNTDFGSFLLTDFTARAHLTPIRPIGGVFEPWFEGGLGYLNIGGGFGRSGSAALIALELGADFWVVRRFAIGPAFEYDLAIASGTASIYAFYVCGTLYFGN